MAILTFSRTASVSFNRFHLSKLSTFSICSLWDWGHIGIAIWQTLSVIYRWKAYHIGFQKIYVGGSESVTGKTYCTPL